MRNADRSGATLPSATILASSVRSSAEEKVGILRRYGSAPDVVPVESALAMFSEITLIRPACARSPDVAIPIERPKSLVSLAMILSLHCHPSAFSPLPQSNLKSFASALADRRLQQMQALAVERGGRRVVHLVGRDLEHFLFQADGVAGGPGLETDLLVLIETFARARWPDMRGAGAQHRQRPHRAGNRAGRIQFRFNQIARLEIRRVGIGDVFGQHALPFLVPLHLGTQRRQHWKIVDGHGAPLSIQRVDSPGGLDSLR